MLRLERSFTQISRRLIAGDIPSLLDHFDLPMAIYSGDKVIVCRDMATLARTIGRYRAWLRWLGGHDIRSDAVAVPLMRGRTGTIWIETTVLDRAGAIIDRWQQRCFFRLFEGLPRICMIEHLPFEEASAAARPDRPGRPALRALNGV